MNAGELISQLAERTGYHSDTLKDILANPALSQINLPDDFKTSVNNNLLTIKEAQINGEIKKHFTGVILGSADATINELMDEYQLPDDVKGTLKSEQSTYARIKLFSKALADLKDQHATAASGDKKKLVDQINELNGAITQLKDQMKNELTATENKWLSKFMDTSINGHFEKYDYAMENVPANIQAMTARQLLEQKLTEKGGKLKYIDGKIQLVSATDDALPFTVDNKPVEFQSFADSIVYDNKLARVKGAPIVAPPPPQTPPINQAPPTAIATKKAISSSLADLRAGSQ